MQGQSGICSARLREYPRQHNIENGAKQRMCSSTYSVALSLVTVVFLTAGADGRTADASGRCPATTADIDLETCAQRIDVSAAELSARFDDPDFAADQRAFYYIRVLENPSCRWTTWLANSAGLALPNDVPATLQNRAWTSPIWMEP